MRKVLITGGAGFIGLHITRSLLKEGYCVTILDNFLPQVHGGVGELPEDIKPHVNLVRGDVRDRDCLTKALHKQNIIVHLAAETGTGQSMYTIQQYESVNVGGTALLYDILINTFSHSIEKIIMASSRALYGEGKYQCLNHGIVYPKIRNQIDLSKGYFEPRCPICLSSCYMLPTDELSPYQPTSFYGMTKQMQEQIAILFGRTMNIDSFALRFQNVYGPGQSLQNPYTGILAIFTTLARQNQSLNIFEDGKASRDFVYIDDVVEVICRCIRHQAPSTLSAMLNVGSGSSTSIQEVASKIKNVLNSQSLVNITGDFRIGDIRHNQADLTAIFDLLGYVPSWSFEDGIRQFLQWAITQTAYGSSVDASFKELKHRGLVNQAKLYTNIKF